MFIDDMQYPALSVSLAAAAGVVEEDAADAGGSSSSSVRELVGLALDADGFGYAGFAAASNLLMDEQAYELLDWRLTTL